MLHGMHLVLSILDASTVQWAASNAHGLQGDGSGSSGVLWRWESSAHCQHCYWNSEPVRRLTTSRYATHDCCLVGPHATWIDLQSMSGWSSSKKLSWQSCSMCSCWSYRRLLSWLSAIDAAAQLTITLFLLQCRDMYAEQRLMFNVCTASRAENCRIVRVKRIPAMCRHGL